MTKQEMLDYYDILHDEENALYTARELNDVLRRQLEEARIVPDKPFICRQCQRAGVSLDYQECPYED